jgi:hypothetical protein
LLDLFLAQNWPIDFASAWNVFRNGGRADNFSNRFGSDWAARRVADFLNAGPDIYDNLLALSADLTSLMAEVYAHHASAADNP